MENGDKEVKNEISLDNNHLIHFYILWTMAYVCPYTNKVINFKP